MTNTPQQAAGQTWVAPAPIPSPVQRRADASIAIGNLPAIAGYFRTGRRIARRHPGRRKIRKLANRIAADLDVRIVAANTLLKTYTPNNTFICGPMAGIAALCRLPFRRLYHVDREALSEIRYLRALHAFYVKEDTPFAWERN